MKLLLPTILVLGTLAACNKKAQKPNPPPAAAQATAEPTAIVTAEPTTNGLEATAVPTADSSPVSVTTETLAVPTTWEGEAPSADALAMAVAGLHDQAKKFQAQFNENQGTTLTGWESKAETCARSVIDGMKFQVNGQSFSVNSTQNFKACVETSQSQVGGSPTAQFGHNLKISCANVDFAPLQDQQITSQQVQNDFCKMATKAEILYNASLATEDPSASGTRVYKHVRALQSSTGTSCVYEAKDSIRTWQDCQWVDKAALGDKGLRFQRIIFNGAKAELGAQGLTFKEGKLDIIIDQWEGQIVFGGPKPTWTLTNKQGQTQTGQLD